LRSGILRNLSQKIRAAEEAEVVESVLSRLGSGQKNVAYGMVAVEKSVCYGAVNLLLVTDEFLREAADEERMKLENLIRECEKRGGKIMMISGEYEAGRKILGLGGIAALLRFPID